MKKQVIDLTNKYGDFELITEYKNGNKIKESIYSCSIEKEQIIITKPESCLFANAVVVIIPLTNIVSLTLIKK